MAEIYGFVNIICLFMICFGIGGILTTFAADFDSKWGRFITFIISCILLGYSMHLIILITNYKSLFGQ
jgi:uncharacterized membrane protein YczE